MGEVAALRASPSVAAAASAYLDARELAAGTRVYAGVLEAFAAVADHPPVAGVP